MGQGQPAARRGALRRAAREGRRATSASASSTSSTRSPAPIPSTGSSIRVVTDRRRTTRCSRGRCSSRRPSDELERLRAGGGRPARARLRGRPRAEDGTRTGTFIALHPTAAGGADRRHVLRGRDQEVDLHADERPAAARGRVPDALLGERRRGRRRRDLLRAVRHRQDDALGRPAAAADRRRRARLGRLGRLQLRGRLLREGDPALAPRPSPRSTRRRARSGRSSRTWSSTSAGALDLDDESKTENTRAAYKIERISNSLRTKMAGHPAHVVFLTADAFAILPPIARLTERAGALLVPGRLHGAGSPAPRSASPSRSRRSRRASAGRSCRSGRRCTRGCWARSSPAHGPDVWLVNTGWTGGSASEGGHRMPIQATRALLHAALSGRLDHAEFRTDPVFGFEVPVPVPGVEPGLLDPRSTWHDPDAYDAKARELAQMFHDELRASSSTSSPRSRPAARSSSARGATRGRCTDRAAPGPACRRGARSRRAPAARGGAGAAGAPASRG